MPAPPVVITTLPLLADLVGRVRAARWVYYCVDDFSVWPGLDGRTMRDMEAELVPKVDACVAVSETLQAHLAKLGKPSHLLTHGVDLDYWRAPVPGDTPVPLRDVNAMPKPLVVYWGVIDRRTDLAFVKALNEVMTDGTILLAGPQDNPDPELLRLPRVRTLPPLPFADLPALAARTAVLIAPYADLPVTRAMQPLKLKEYIATGKPVVVRDTPRHRRLGRLRRCGGHTGGVLAGRADAVARGRAGGAAPGARAIGGRRLGPEGGTVRELGGWVINFKPRDRSPWACALSAGHLG